VMNNLQGLPLRTSLLRPPSVGRVRANTLTNLGTRGHVAELGKALQSLKHQLNLPAHTVRSQNVRRRTAGAGREHDHELGKFECSRPRDHLLLTCSALQAAMSLLNRAIALS